MTLSKRISRYDWTSAGAHLGDHGWVVLEGLLRAADCKSMIRLFDDDERFRKIVDMGAHGYGRGEYRYFAYPLPDLVAELREALYSPLAAVANEWYERLRMMRRFPSQHHELVAQCHEGEQRRPTPLLLRYGPGDYNRLHQDVYGEHLFPLQVAILLSEPESDFTGGEFILTEQRARMQSRASVIPLRRGDAVAFAVRELPVQGSRGTVRAVMRHGVSEIRSGRRYTLGIIFHDAK
jgi:hypothetical protein